MKRIGKVRKMALGNWMQAGIVIDTKAGTVSYGEDELIGKEYKAELYKNHVNIKEVKKEGNLIAQIYGNGGGYVDMISDFGISFWTIKANQNYHTVWLIEAWESKKILVAATGYAFSGIQGRYIGLSRKVKKKFQKILKEEEPQYADLVDMKRVMQQNQGFWAAMWDIPLGKRKKMERISIKRLFRDIYNSIYLQYRIWQNLLKSKRRNKK